MRDKDEALQKLSLLMQQGGVWMLRVQLVVGRDVVAIVDADKRVMHNKPYQVNIKT